MSKSAPPPPEFKLHIDAHALLQLGEQLISDDAQAILELVKNSYDADAQWAKIRIDSTFIPDSIEAVSPTAVGLIEVEDNGVGMDLKTLQDSWLRISFSFKRLHKAQLKRTEVFKRLPIGDKGLGRLGTMRLGSYLSVETHVSPDREGWNLTFQWSDIRSGHALESVPITARKIPANGKRGTTVRIYGLRDIANWKKQKRVKDLRVRLCGLISPFGAFRDFDVSLNVEGKKSSLETITESLRETSTIRFDYNWDGDALRIDGRVKLTWFRKDPVTYDQFISQDGGARLSEALMKGKKVTTEYGLALIEKGGWFVKVSATYEKGDIHFDQEYAEDPGPFAGSLDYFDLGGMTEIPTKLFDRRSDYQAIVKDLAQIYIYRDGFGIGMNKDWLNLGGAWTGAKGYYSLKPNNVIGYFAISVEKNSKLEEKSDREGFVDNSSWRGFKLLAESVKKFANDSLNALGRGSVKYIKEAAGDHATTEESEKNYGELVNTLENVLSSSKSVETELRQNAEDRRNTLFAIGGAARMISIDMSQPKQRREEAKKLMNAAENLVPILDSDHQKVLGLLKQLDTERPLPGIIRLKVDEFEERSQLLYEMVAVGLSAQALAHDVPAVLTQIADSAKALIKLAKADYVESQQVRTHAEAIDSSAAGVSEMIDFVKPMLRGRRLTRQKAMLSEFVDNYYTLRGARLRTRGIHWHLDREGMRDFRINFNTGRIIQILDNLTTNSEYWVDQQHRPADKKGKISLTINDPELKFWDNGPGIRPDLEETLFDLFTSGRSADDGNGLGLFITEQLLLRDNCTITLDSTRNEQNRLFRFVLNFSGAKAIGK